MLYLQRAKKEHAQIWFSLLEENRAYLEPWLPHLKDITTLATAQAYLKKYEALDIYLGSHIYELWTQDGELVGLATLHSGRFNDQSAELAYWLGAAYTRKGYATAACRHLISMAFATQRLTSLRIRCLRDNLPSQQVAQRLEMQPIPSKEDQVLYELLQENWTQDTDYWLWFLED